MRDRKQVHAWTVSLRTLRSVCVGALLGAFACATSNAPTNGLDAGVRDGAATADAWAPDSSVPDASMPAETGDAAPWPTELDIYEREPNDDVGALQLSFPVGESRTTIGGALADQDVDGFLLSVETGSLLLVRLAQVRGPADRLHLSWNVLDPDGRVAFSQTYELGVGEHAELFAASGASNQLALSASTLGSNEDATEYVLEVERREVAPSVIALDERVSIAEEDAGLAMLQFEAPHSGSYQLTGDTLGGLDVGLYDVEAEQAVPRVWETVADVAAALRFDAVQGQSFWLLGSTEPNREARPSFALSVQFEAGVRELSDGDRVQAQIDPTTALGVPDADTFLVTLGDGEALRVAVQAESELQPALLGWGEPSLPVAGQAARELECRGELCEWELTVTDARSLNDPSASVGGPGFGYSISADAFTPAPISIELPFTTESAELPVVGAQLRYRGSAPIGDVLLCEGRDPDGLLSLVCERTERSLDEGHVSLLLDSAFSIHVHDVNHRGAPSALAVSIRSAAIPDDLPLQEDDALSVPLTLPARVGGPAETNAELRRISVEVASGAYVIALARTEDASTTAQVEFEALDAEGAAYRNSNGQAGFRATRAGLVELVVDARCEGEDTPCTGAERYELTVFEEAAVGPPALD